MRRGLKWLVRGSGCLAVLAAVLLVAYVTALPGLVESRAVAALRDLGFQNVRLQVRRVALGGADIAGISIGREGRLRIDHFRVDYAPDELLDGRIRLIEVIGLRFDARVRDGVLDLGPLDEIERGGGGDGGSGGDLPIDRLVLRGAEFSIDLDGERLSIPFDATVDVNGARLAFDVDARHAGTSVHVAGTTDLSATDVDVVLEGVVASVSTYLGFLPEETRALAGAVQGGVSFTTHVRRDAGETRVEASASTAGLSWHGRLDGRAASVEEVALELTKVRGRIAPGATPSLDAFDLEVRSARIEVAGLPGLSASLHARSTGTGDVELDVEARGANAVDHLAVDARATGLVGGASLSEISGSVRGTLAWETLRAVAPAVSEKVAPASGTTLEMTAKMSAAPAPDEVDAPWRATASGVVGARMQDVSLPGSGARLEDARVDVSFVCASGPDETTLRVEAGSGLAADAVTWADSASERRLDARGDGAVVFELSRPLRVRVAPSTPLSVIGEGWSARVLDATFTDPASRMALDGAALELVGDLVVDGDLVTARVLAPSHLRVRDLELPEVGVIAVQPGEDLLRAECVEAVRADLDLGDEGGWKVGAPALRVRTRESDVTVEASDLHLERASLDWTVAASATPAGGSLASVGEGVVSFAEGSGRAGEQRAVLGPTQVSLVPIEEQLASATVDETGVRVAAGVRATTRGLSLAADSVGSATLASLSLDVAASGVGGALDLSGHLLAAGSASVAVSGTEVEVGAVALETSVTVPAGGAMEVRGTLNVDETSVRHAAQRLDVVGVSAEVPFAIGAVENSEGRFEIESIWRGDDYLPGFVGTLSMSEERVRVGLEWPVLEGVTAIGEGWIDPMGRVSRGEFVLTVPRFEITEFNQPADVFGALAGTQLGGAVALDARIGIEGPRIDPLITLTLNDASLSSTKWDASAEGVNASVTVDSFEPFSTPGDQTITMSRASLGQLEVADGVVAFRLEGPRSLLIERTAWGWAGGRLLSHAIRIDPGDPSLDVTVFADHLDLSELAAIVAPDQIAGEGTLYGRLPVTVDWPKISYGTGFLYAEPGVGRLQVHDMTGFWERLPEEARGALRDFEFSVLKADLVAGGDAKVRLRGKGLDPAYTREVILDLNVHGIDDLLDTAIIVTRVPTQLFDG